MVTSALRWRATSGSCRKISHGVAYQRYARFSLPLAFPRELDSHRLTLLRDPDSVDAPKGAHVALACHGNSERFLLVRQHNRFQDCSVCVGDRHTSILRLPASANKSLQVQCFRPVGTGPVLTMVMDLQLREPRKLTLLPDLRYSWKPPRL